MILIIKIPLIILGIFVLYEIIVRIFRRFIHFPAPVFIGCFLDSSLRKRLQPPDKMIQRSGIKQGMHILEIGCGSGRFTKALADHFAAKVYGIDPSSKMLMIAKQNIISPMLEFIKSSAENIPLGDDIADMLFLSQVYHHIQNKIKAVCEFKRILKKDGFLCIRTSTTDTLDCYLYLRFFPEARKIDLVNLPSRKEIQKFFHTKGFELTCHTIVNQIFAENLNKYFEKISLRGFSDIEAITDEEFQQGLSRLKKYCQEQKTEEPIFEDIDLFIFQLT